MSEMHRTNRSCNRLHLVSGGSEANDFCYHCPLDQSYPSCRVACADDLERVIQQEDPDTVAAFIAEPVIGASAGAAVPPDEYARAARDICSKYGVLYIDDEVMTGCRTDSPRRTGPRNRVRH